MNKQTKILHELIECIGARLLVLTDVIEYTLRETDRYEYKEQMEHLTHTWNRCQDDFRSMLEDDQ